MIDGSDPTEGFIAVGDGAPFAFLQRYRFDENPEWQRTVAGALAEGSGTGGAGGATGTAAGIDYLIGDQTMTGRGLGKRMIAALVDLIWDRYPDITAVIVAVDQGNDASWRALEGAGFRRIWSGTLDSDDPSDEGPSYLYVRHRSEMRNIDSGA
jgi:aminoglycoside 6'-N-acetyltransferase